ncbi:DNA-deoxyinosine glycosylase [Glaciimonas soli]|uniref:DNA-deoxyinosine glycosylase n=1 Tax=Glaciimonas soli TaxID=2590999 RepID=A0A843YIX4_9BURK|nr:DNA-deoxyinosine glycosylase [Glaciimonas soli]MQQ99728.1 DNA-deoxyinosine glycosylase [Glaciimonas soli]
MPTAISSGSLTGFAPVIDRNTRTLILGSFPGTASLALQQYYGHPRNQFWRLLSAVLAVDLVNLPYAERLTALLSQKIGLWDVLAACERRGSLDSAIRNPLANQFDFLQQHCPQLQRICFNGKTSGKFASQFSVAGFETLILPSSSPANAQSTFDEKLQLWRGIIA